MLEQSIKNFAREYLEFKSEYVDAIKDDDGYPKDIKYVF